MNEQNLIPNTERSASEVRENQRRGGVNSGIARRERAALAESIRLVLAEKTPEGLTKQQALVAKCLANAFKKGDVKDLKTIAEILGEIKQNIDVNAALIRPRMVYDDEVQSNTEEHGKDID